MNMQKYASYKKAAKRIVRLLNEEREMKKEAGQLHDFFSPPVGPGAPQFDKNGKPITPQHPSAEIWHPKTYLSANNSTGDRREAVPLAWLKYSPETGVGTESHENYDLSHEFRDSYLPPIGDPTGAYARERAAINRRLIELEKLRAAEGRGTTYKPSDTTTSRYNAQNGWREHSWLKPWTWRMFGK